MTDQEIEDQKKRHAGAFSRETLDRGKKKQKPSSKLTDDVIRFIRSIGGAARRVNSQGQFDPNTETWRFSGMKRGFEDVDGCIPVTVRGFKYGLKFGIEIKIGRDSPSEYQVKRKVELDAAGGYYLFASSIEQISADIVNIIERIKNVTNTDGY